jgi:hypothetical protein
VAEPTSGAVWLSPGTTDCWHSGHEPGDVCKPTCYSAVGPLYKTDDLIWCARCDREESVGAVTHDDGPYTTDNSRMVRPVAACGGEGRG